MRALICDDSGPKLVTNHPDPVAAEGEVVIRTLKAGVSVVDVELCRGLLGFSGVLGHQFVGVVEGGTDAAGDKLVGQRVVGAIHAVCGECDMCRSGLRSHCRKQTILGVRGRPGCLADRFSLPSLNLIPVPDSLDDDHAVFAVTVARALQAARQFTIEGKPFITVLGDGPMALVTGQVMSRMNASVRVIGRHAERLSLCEKWGLKHRHIDDIGRRADQDVVVDCTESADGLAIAMQLVRPRGKIILKSMLAPATMAEGYDLTPLVAKELELIGSGSGPIREGLAAIERGEVDVLSLMGRRMRLDDGPAVLHAAAEPGAAKVVVDV